MKQSMDLWVSELSIYRRMRVRNSSRVLGLLRKQPMQVCQYHPCLLKREQLTHHTAGDSGAARFLYSSKKVIK